MPFDKDNLPAPPAFPASNASYNSIVGKMHKSALLATTPEAAIAAVSMIKNHVTGTNTYAKATRRYADRLIGEIQAVELADAIGIEKPAMPQLAKKAAPKKSAPKKVKRGVAA